MAQPSPLSRRAYARLSGCSERAVRNGIERGRIKPLAPGLIDPSRADEAWFKWNLLEHEPVRAGSPPTPRATRRRDRRLFADLFKASSESVVVEMVGSEPTRDYAGVPSYESTWLLCRSPDFQRFVDSGIIHTSLDRHSVPPSPR